MPCQLSVVRCRWSCRWLMPQLSKETSGGQLGPCPGATKATGHCLLLTAYCLCFLAAAYCLWGVCVSCRCHHSRSDLQCSARSNSRTKIPSSLTNDVPGGRRNEHHQ